MDDFQLAWPFMIPIVGTICTFAFLIVLTLSRSRMRELEIRPSPGGASEVNISLAGLAAGEYIIEVTATGSAGNAKDVVDFRVTN